MIAIIGAMVGAYIIARMIELLSLDRPAAVKLAAVVTIIVALLGIVGVFEGGGGVNGMRKGGL